MPAVSAAQQRFMGMVHAVQKGDMKAPSKSVADAAKSMSKKDAKDFASTKHEGLPEHVKKALSELGKGMEEEKEHGFNKALRREVAKDHLRENKNYYTILENCMDKNEKSANCSEHDKNIPASFDARQKPFTGKPKGKKPVEKKAFELGFIKAATAAGLSIGQAVDLLISLDKEATISDTESFAGNTLAKALLQGGVGAGIGGGLGGLAGYMAGKDNEHPENDHSTRDAILGALLGAGTGAAVGGGGSALHDINQNPALFKKTIDEILSPAQVQQKVVMR